MCVVSTPLRFLTSFITTRTMPNTIKLRSSDDETFEVDEDVALYVSTDGWTEDATRRERRIHSFIHSFIQ